MSKYFKFVYEGGYLGSQETAIFKFPESATKEEVQMEFETWYEEQRKDFGEIEEISEEDAQEEGIDEDREGDWE